MVAQPKNNTRMRKASETTRNVSQNHRHGWSFFTGSGWMPELADPSDSDEFGFCDDWEF
jgi:hypothetical protein